MASSIVLQAIPVDHICLTDEVGRVFWVAAQTVEALLSTGVQEISPRLRLRRLTGDAPETLTVTEAAKLLIEDFGDLTLVRAKARISRACDRGEVTATGRGRARRIDPTSLAAWRLRQRDRDLDRVDAIE